MEFPVDLLADVSQVELEQSAHNYINNLLYSNPDLPEHLILSDSTQVTINISSVGFTPLYGLSDKHKILALFSPSDPMTAVALYLLDQWWTVDDILKTADPDRDGAMEVETLGERVVLYILNRIIYRAKEMTSEELPFLCHGEKDCAKILWNKGEAVGFYSVKPSGSIYNSSSTRSYLLPVMDSIFVRKCHRGKGFGFQMLEDFVLSSHEDCLGLRYPLTKSMYKVCQKYLCQYPEHTDLLWEVESIGGPSQRTNIARKIQAMDLSAVSKSLVYTEESVVITEMTETDVVMEAIPTQIKETESVECTVDIVEEVTVRRGTKVSEAELPVAARGRSGGSKRRNVEERITEEKSEKIIRIEDIEAETPRDEQLGAQQKTELNDGSELVQTEGMFSIGEDVVDTAPKEAATATISDTPATVLPSQDLEEDDVTATPTTVKPQVEDDLNTLHDSQITVENVASEIEEAEEEHKEEDSAVLVAQHVVSLSTHATSEGGEAGKTGRAVVKAIKIVQSETPRRRSQRHRKLEEEITAQDRGRVLRARTVMSTATPKRNSTRHSHKVNEESEKEVDVAEENNVSSTEVLEELTVTGGKELEEIASIKEDVTTVEELKEEVKQQVEDEELTSAEETEKQEEPGVKDTVVKGSSTELPDTAKNALTEVNVDEKVTDESEKEQKGEEVEKSVVEDKQQVSDDEIEEPPVVQKRASRGRRKVTPKSTQQSEGHKKQEEERTDEADLGAGSAASEEKADEKAMDKQMEEETVDKTEENKSAEELTVVEEGTKAEEPAEDVTPSTEVKVEECMEVQEDKETEGGTETVSVMEADKDKEEDDMIQDPNTVAAASETVTPDEVDETAISVAEEPQEKDIEIPKLQKATVILVDLKTCSHLSVKEAEETPADGECSAPEKELISAEEKDISSYVAEEQAPEPKMLVLEEEDGGKQENNTEESLDATAEAETVEKQELEEDSSDKEKKESANVDGEMSEAEEAPFVEARVLRSGRKLVKETYQQYNIGDVVTEKEVDEAEPGNGEVEGEKEVTGKDAVAVTVPVEEKPSAESLSKICADTEPDIPVVDDTEDNLPPAEGDDAISLEEDERPGGTKTPRCKTTRKQADEQEAESSEEEETAVTTRTLSRGRESASATPKGKSRRSSKQEEEQKGAEESKKIKETGGDEGKAPEEDQMEVEEEEPLPVEVKEASIEERGEKNKREIEAVSKKEESVEQTIDVEEGKAVAEEGQYVEEEQLEAIVASAEKTLQEEEDGPKESAKEAEVEEEKEEEEEEGLRSAKEPLTEVDEAPEEDKTEVEKEELVPVEVEKGVSEEGTMTEEEENTAGEAATADDLVQEGDMDTPSTKPAADSAIRTPSEEEPTPSAEEQHSEEILPKLPDLQRVSVVVVDLKKTNHEVQEEMATVEEGVPGEKTAAEEEEKVEETTKAEEIMAEDQVPGSLVGIEKTESEKVVVEEEGFEEKAEDAVAIQDTAGETAKQDEAKTVDADDEEEEHTVAEIRAQRGKKKAVKATPTRKLARGRQKKGVEEKEESTEIREEEPAVEVRVLRRGRKSIPVTPRCTTKRTHKHIQEEQEEEEEEEGGEESTAVERQAEEQAEEQQQTIDQEEGERVEVKNATQQAENIEPEKVDPVSEEGQASSSETEAPVGADEGKTLDDAAEEAVTVPDTVEGEQSTSTAEPAPLTAKDDEAEGISEEEPPVIEPRVLRSGEETVKATARSKTTKRDHQDKEATGEKSTEEESAVGTRVLRKGRRSAPATPRRKSKRPRTQCQPEEEGEEETTHAEETEGEEEEAGQELHEEKCEMAEEEGKSVEMGLKEDKDVEKEEAECVAGKESTPAEEMQAGEVKAALEKSTEKEENKDEKIEEEAAAEKEENTEPEEDNEQEEEAAGERSTEDEVAVETRVLRKGRRSAPATPKRKSKRARRQCQTEDDGENKATLAEDIQIEESKTDEKKDNSDEKTQEKDGEEPVANEEDNTETKIEIKKVEAVLEESLPEQETAEEEQPAETHAHGQEETPVVESAEETPNTDEGKVTDEEEASVVETRVLRSGGKAVKAAQRSKTAKKQHEETEQEGTVVEKSADTDTEPAIETRVLKKGRRSAPATPRRKSKRARTQCQPEEEGDGTTPGEETEGEEEEAGHELPEVKGEKAEEEGMSMEVGVKKDKDVEEDKVESVAGGESAEQITDTLTDEAAVLEKEDNNMAAGDETGTDMVEVEEIKSAKEEGTTVTEKSTAAAEMGSHTAIVEGEALAADESVVAEEQALAVTTRTLRSKTKTSLATSLQRSRKQKGQGAVEQEEQEEETPEDEETEEVHQFTDDSPENGEQEETDETLPTGQEAGPPAEDNAEDQAKEIADDRLVESAGEEPETEEMESLEEEPSESKEDKPQDSSEVESRSLRGKRKTVADKEDIAEEIQLPKRRSVRKRPRVDYKENDEEDEGGETEAATDKEEENTVESDKDKDDKEAEGPADEPELEESSREDNLQNNVGAVESTGEKGDIINLVLDIDEEVETAGIRPEDEEDEGSMSEEEEPKVIGKRVLRGRSIPSIIITPHSKSRHRSPKVKKAEESLFDEEKSPQSSQKRSLRKRKSTEVTPTRKSKRHSRV